MSAHWTEKDLAAVRARLHGEKHSPLRSKFRNVAMEVDGFRFDSKLEVRRYRELLQMEHSKLITDLQVKPEFALHAPTPTGQLERIGSYTPEFSYLRDGKKHLEDCKSIPTRRLAMYRWKAHHFAVEYGLEVIEISRRHRETPP